MPPRLDSRTRREVRLLTRLSAPVVVGNLGIVGLWATDTIMVGRFGGTAIAAVAAASTWSYAVSVVGRGAAKGLDPLVAQAVGRGDRAAAAAWLRRGVAAALLLSPPIVVLHLLVGPGLRLLGQPASLLPLAVPYTWILAIDVPLMLVFGAVQQHLQAQGRMRPPAAAILAGNLVNIGLNLLLMFGLGPLPGLGPLGCAWATVLSQAFMLVLLLALARRELRGDLSAGAAKGRIFDRDLLRLLALGLPIGLQLGVETWGFQLAGVMMGWLGEVELAGHAVALNVATISFMIPMGIGAAVATRTGQLAGAGRPWLPAARTGIGMGALVMSLFGLLFLIAPGLIGRLYTDDPAVIAMVVLLLPLAGAFQLFDGTQVVSFGALRGLADVRVPTLVNVVAYWGLGLPLAWALAFPFGLGARGVWMGLVVSLALVAVLLLGRIAVLARATPTGSLAPHR